MSGDPYINGGIMWAVRAAAERENAEAVLSLIREWDEDGEDDGPPLMTPDERQMLAGFLVRRGIRLVRCAA